MAGGISSHSYLVLKEKPLFPQGSLVELRNGSYYHHSDIWRYASMESVSFTPDELAPLTKEKCILLDSIGPNSYTARYTVFSTPGKLAWGMKLKVGDPVLARLPDRWGCSDGEHGQYANAVIQSIRVKVELEGRRILYGVKITDPEHFGHGDTDGTYKYSCYISRKENCGLFLSLAELNPPPAVSPAEPHAYLLLEDHKPYSQGALMQLHRNGHTYQGHSHLWYTVFEPIFTESLAPLTKSKCKILDAIAPGFTDDADRYTVYSTPSKLEWGVKLKVGDSVLAQLPGCDPTSAQNTYAKAVIRAIGVEEQQGMRRHLFGVELVEPQYFGCGNSNGTYNSTKYFLCDPGCGLFLTLAAMKPLHQLVSLEAHSYLLLEDCPPYSRGTLMELDKEGRYRGHSHSPYSVPDSILSDAVVPLTEDECVLLDAISVTTSSSNAARYTVYSTPGKLAWGVGLKVGDKVLARMPSWGVSTTQDQYASAVIRSIAIVDEDNQHKLFGVEIEDRRFHGCGNSDGTYVFDNRKIPFFTCKEKCGLFLSVAELRLPSCCEALSAVLQEQVSRLKRELRQKTQLFQASVDRLQREVKERDTRLADLERRVRDEEVSRLQELLRERDDMIASIFGREKQTYRVW